MLLTLAPTLLVVGLFILMFGLRDLGINLPLRPDDPRMRTALFAVLAVLLARYLYWRLTETVPPPELSVAGLWPYLFLVFELTAMLMLAVTYMTLSRRTDWTALVNASLAQVDPNTPVALLIPTYNEPLGVLQRTILGAMGQDHPGTRVWVLDDGRRDWLRLYCEELGVGYVARQDNHGAKAGNMNHGLAAIRASGFDPVFIGVLDADFVATTAFISRCLALHAARPDTGIVQSPQHFFNPDPVQMNLSLSGIAPDEQRFFFDELQPSKDAWGTAFCCGTSSVIRSASVDAIGGFPTDSVTEDMLMSLRMREKGWQTRYLNEPLTTGLAPEGLGEYIVQRHRWCLGFIQIFRDHYNPFSRRHRLGFVDRLHILDTFLYWGMSFPTRYLFLLAPAIYWTTGWRVIDAQLPDILSYLVPWLVLHMTVMTWISRGSLQPVLNDINQLLIVPAAIHATLTGLFSRAKHKFKVTPKGLLGDRVTVDWQALRPILILLAINLVGVILAAIPGLQPGLPYAPRMVNLFWLVINFLILAVAVLTCIELPRRRSQERFPYLGRGRAGLWVAGRRWPVRIRELSLSGCSLELEEYDADVERFLDRRADIDLGDGDRLPAEILRDDASVHSVRLGARFEGLTVPQQLSLIKAIYGEGNARLTYHPTTSTLLKEVLARLVQAKKPD